MDHVLDPALPGPDIGGDLLEAPPFVDRRDPLVCLGDIPDQDVIKLGRRLSEQKPGFDTAPPQFDRMGQVQNLRLQAFGSKVDRRREGRGLDSHG